MISQLRKKFAGSGSHFLAFLLCALILPSAAVVLVAVAGMLSQERAMEAAVSSYVQDLAESMSYHLSSDSDVWTFSMLSDFTRFPFFSWGPSIPGWVALIGQDGRVIIASPGSMDIISSIWHNDMTIGKAVRVEDNGGSQYTLAVYPVKRPSGGYVVAAVSWTQLLGGLVVVVRIWPILIVVMAGLSFFAIRLLWRRVVTPLRSLASKIDSMTLGKDVPEKLPEGTIQEIESVHGALQRYAQAAVERDNLRNRYVRDVVQAQEQERMDMAREIHDGALQDVTALLQQIHMIEDDENKTSRLKRTEIIAKTVVRELRQFCDELAPPWMDLGINEAITELAERLSQAYDIIIMTDYDEGTDEAEIENDKILSLLRIIQEAVSNAVRHGQASEVDIQLTRENDTLTLEIQDNGKGFEAGNINHETLRVEGHRGLASMTERMSLMSGKLSITSKPGEGTKIIASLKV
ncbi:MAG: sensor histidine kinase [Synergistaceae bacterium]|nr:sensor histidine kinase [Synergistaceae bacterium]MBQ3760216.1 sensor histidine kinase [Synergistaceae bacterium]MBQ6114038.1 sensor histidine kinase [Synergistaceae bacterium]MBQ6418005.1 sensor histidine kinase [Synergistaceae bacterium]MBQ6665838.1 sensor histidine kinase [Synergistaceae bacterium]